MRVILDTAIFTDKSINPLELYCLLRFGTEERHLIQTEPIDSKEISDWLDKQPEEDRLWFEFALMDGVRGATNINPAFPPFTIRVSSIKQSIWDATPYPVLSLEDATNFLYRPLIIFLENRRSDRAFLETVANIVTIELNLQTGEIVSGRERLKWLVARNWIDFQTGGGITESLSWIKEISAKPEQYLRSFMLFDSDALSPGKPGENSSNVVEACHKIPGFDTHYHQLKRRAIENYLPIEVLAEIWVKQVKAKEKRKRESKVRAFRKLTPPQRHHFNMKKGFEGDKQHSAKVGNLYAYLDTLTKQRLISGFGGKMAELFKQEPPQIKAEWLLQDNQLSEIEPLVLKILALV